MTQQRIFRFAPSPNGFLHLGHAYSAFVNQSLARSCDGSVLLRIEDIDTLRCTPELAQAAIDDLTWLGLHDGGTVRFQSANLEIYGDALRKLDGMGLLYHCSCSRRDLERSTTVQDPEGQALYTGQCRPHGAKANQPYALRIDMAKAVQRAGALSWWENGKMVKADPEAWGDVILGRKDIGVSYHIAVVVDDAIQRVTDVVRGEDLYHATSIHRLLQKLLGLSQPRYHHHQLIRTEAGEKLSKSRKHRSIRDMRADGISRSEILALLERYDADLRRTIS